jgi:hypothetical protein
MGGVKSVGKISYLSELRRRKIQEELGRDI